MPPRSLCGGVGASRLERRRHVEEGRTWPGTIGPLVAVVPIISGAYELAAPVGRAALPRSGALPLVEPVVVRLPVLRVMVWPGCGPLVPRRRAGRSARPCRRRRSRSAPWWARAAGRVRTHARCSVARFRCWSFGCRWRWRWRCGRHWAGPIVRREHPTRPGACPLRPPVPPRLDALDPLERPVPLRAPPPEGRPEPPERLAPPAARPDWFGRAGRPDNTRRGATIRPRQVRGHRAILRGPLFLRRQVFDHPPPRSTVTAASYL